MKNTKRILALLSAILLLAAFLPAMASAADGNGYNADWDSLRAAVAGEEQETVPGLFEVDDTTIPGTRIVKMLDGITAEDTNIALSVPAGKTVLLDLNGNTIDRGLSEAAAKAGGSVIIVYGTLTVDDSSVGKTGKITGGNTSHAGGGIVVVAGGALTLSGGSITGNKAISEVGFGGGVCVEGGSTFTLTGGSIDHNLALLGGGIGMAAGSELYMSGSAVVTLNQTLAEGAGGGIFVQGSVSMEGGEISENTAKSGAGVYVYAQDDTKSVIAYHFTMTGGKITKNEAAFEGGGIYADNYDIDVCLLGGEVTGNKAGSSGGGVLANRPVAVGGTVKVTDNTAGAAGSESANNLFLCTVGKRAYTPIVAFVPTTPLQSGALIGISSDAALWDGGSVSVTGPCTYDCSSFFRVDNSDDYRLVPAEDKRLLLTMTPCVHQQKLPEPRPGKYTLKLGNTEIGEFTFARDGNGWTISAEKGLYLGVNNGALGYQAEPFAWSWDGKAFYVNELTYIGGFRFGPIVFPGIPVLTKLYPTALGAPLSSDFCASSVWETAPDEAGHKFSDWIPDGTGMHTRICVNCGKTIVKACEYDGSVCKICGGHKSGSSYVTVEVREETRKKPNPLSILFPFLPTETETVYTIFAQPHDTSVLTVEYSLDGGRSWTRGTTFTAKKKPVSFEIRVRNTSGGTQRFTYANGKVTEKR